MQLLSLSIARFPSSCHSEERSDEESRNIHVNVFRFFTNAQNYKALYCFLHLNLVRTIKNNAPVSVSQRSRIRCFTDTAALLHECGCVNRWDTSRFFIKVLILMQEMQASFNFLSISLFGCICSMQMCCNTCKFTDFLASLATRFFTTCQCYPLWIRELNNACISCMRF